MQTKIGWELKSTRSTKLTKKNSYKLMKLVNIIIQIQAVVKQNPISSQRAHASSFWNKV